VSKPASTENAKPTNNATTTTHVNHNQARHAPTARETAAAKPEKPVATTSASVVTLVETGLAPPGKEKTARPAPKTANAQQDKPAKQTTAKSQTVVATASVSPPKKKTAAPAHKTANAALDSSAMQVHARPPAETAHAKPAKAKTVRPAPKTALAKALKHASPARANDVAPAAGVRFGHATVAKPNANVAVSSTITKKKPSPANMAAKKTPSTMHAVYAAPAPNAVQGPATTTSKNANLTAWVGKKSKPVTTTTTTSVVRPPSNAFATRTTSAAKSATTDAAAVANANFARRTPHRDACIGAKVPFPAKVARHSVSKANAVPASQAPSGAMANPSNNATPTAKPGKSSKHAALAFVVEIDVGVFESEKETILRASYRP
jgi:hypothetical protein